MKSRFLTHLDEDIAAASDKVTRRCLMAERAAYLARLGEIAEARRELGGVQCENSKEPNIRVSIISNIADGLCHYYENMSPEANDRYQRARAIAVASKQFDLQARVESLLALLEYGAHRFEELFASLEVAAERALYSDKQTLCRICMLAGQALHLANRFDLALDWYQQARYYANECLDDASVSAILHNMASIWAVNCRNSQLGGIATKDDPHMARVGAASTSNYDKIVGSSVLSVLTPLMKAQLRSLEGEYTEALAIYDEYLPSLNLKALGGWQAWLLADMAWCNIKLGDSNLARLRFAQCSAGINASYHLDDRGAIFSRLSEGMVILNEIELAKSYKVEAINAWDSFIVLQNRICVLATAFSEQRSSLLSRRLK